MSAAKRRIAARIRPRGLAEEHIVVWRQIARALRRELERLKKEAAR